MRLYRSSVVNWTLPSPFASDTCYFCGGQECRDDDKTLPTNRWRREASAGGWQSRDVTQNHLFLSLTAFEFVVAPDVGTVEVSRCLFFVFHPVAWISY
jgi:hypothetical protein